MPTLLTRLFVFTEYDGTWDKFGTYIQFVETLWLDKYNISNKLVRFTLVAGDDVEQWKGLWPQDLNNTFIDFGIVKWLKYE